MPHDRWWDGLEWPLGVAGVLFVVGVVMARYILELEPFASLPVEQIAETIAPNLQHYLTGELPGLG